MVDGFTPSSPPFAPSSVITSADTPTRPHFFPPLWMQRRAFASRVLHDFPYEHVLDVGCGEGALLEILVNSSHFTRLSGVDIDLECIREAQATLQPTKYQQMFPRERTVVIDLYTGSIVDVDPRFIGCDCVVSLEVIEHLHAEVLASFKLNVFGVYQPQLVILTTPNAEYNVHFSNLNYGTTDATFRHYDHKFEWTRSEFREWCNDACKLYGQDDLYSRLITRYSVVYSGVGFKADDLACGPCSQAAVFYKIGTVNVNVVTRISTWTQMHSMTRTALPKTSKIVDVVLKQMRGCEKITIDCLWESYDVKLASGCVSDLLAALKESKRSLIFHLILF